MTKYALILSMVLAIGLAFSVKTCQDNKEEADRFRGNQEALMKKADFYRTQDSLSAASVRRLELTVQELVEDREDLTKEVKRLKIKPSRVQSISQTAIETNTQITAPTTIQTIQEPGKKPTTRECFDHQDKWQTISGCVQDGVFKGTTHSIDSIVTVAHRVPRKFLFLKYGTKAIRQEVLNKNPNGSIFYTEYIEIKK